MAGTLLALELKQRGHGFSIVQDPSLPSSSRVAAGLINPLVFKRLLPSWRAAEFLPFLQKKYKELEILLDEKFIFFLSITKIIENQHELETWQNRSNAADIRDFIDGGITHENPEGLKETTVLGFGHVVQSGYVDTNLFLNAAARFFKKTNNFKEEAFSYEQLELTAKGAVYQGNKYDAVVFCEGFFVHRNPYFSFLPFKPVKGDVLTVQMEGYQSKDILNKNFFLLPLSDGTYRLGATYDWKNLNFEPSEDAKNDLLKRIKEYVSENIKILKHEAGVRPSSEDRRPILGPHPEHSQLYVFNGLGTKGVMLAPYFAAQMADHLLDDTAIEKEVFVGRFYGLKQ